MFRYVSPWRFQLRIAFAREVLSYEEAIFRMGIHSGGDPTAGQSDNM
jgi:hypothetical protein